MRMRTLWRWSGMEEADVRHVVDRVIEQWWGTIVVTPECGEPAKQSLKDRLVRCVMGLLAHAENAVCSQERAANAASCRSLSR